MMIVLHLSLSSTYNNTLDEVIPNVLDRLLFKHKSLCIRSVVSEEKEYFCVNWRTKYIQSTDQTRLGKSNRVFTSIFLNTFSLAFEERETFLWNRLWVNEKTNTVFLAEWKMNFVFCDDIRVFVVIFGNHLQKIFTTKCSFFLYVLFHVNSFPSV